MKRIQFYILTQNEKEFKSDKPDTHRDFIRNVFSSFWCKIYFISKEKDN